MGRWFYEARVRVHDAVSGKWMDVGVVAANKTRELHRLVSRSTRNGRMALAMRRRA